MRSLTPRDLTERPPRPTSLWKCKARHRRENTEGETAGHHQARAPIESTQPRTPPPGAAILLNLLRKVPATRKYHRRKTIALQSSSSNCLRCLISTSCVALSDNEFVNIADHIRLQQAVTGLALLVLHPQGKPEHKQSHKERDEHYTEPASQNKVDIGTHAHDAPTQSTDSEREKSDLFRSSLGGADFSCVGTNEAQQIRGDKTAPQENAVRATLASLFIRYTHLPPTGTRVLVRGRYQTRILLAGLHFMSGTQGTAITHLRGATRTCHILPQ